MFDAALGDGGCDQPGDQKCTRNQGQIAGHEEQHKQGEQGQRDVDHGLGDQTDQKAAQAFVAAQTRGGAADAGRQLVEADVQKATKYGAGQALVDEVGQVMDLARTQPFAQHFEQDGGEDAEGERQQGAAGLGGDYAVINLHGVERGGQGQHRYRQGGSGNVDDGAGVPPNFAPDQLEAGAGRWRKTGHHAQAHGLAAGGEVAHGFFAELPQRGAPALHGPGAVVAAGHDEGGELVWLQQQCGQARGVGLATALRTGPALRLGQRCEGLQQLGRRDLL